ncbi:unnamed protein product [Rhizoctonia solani]|uniref:Fungal-type protein kinase domain-containing protein n=1 Tax=Rhizoctonia solani TaxID=456999 RepID=A0A8H3HQ08_9AGAM|nr:unnamed protein product [Rhizoctonia solani]
MDDNLHVEEEIYGNLYHDPKFFEHFLSAPSTKLDSVLKYCSRSNVYARRTNSWNPTPRVTRRSGTEPPLLKLLNTIIRATRAAGSSNLNGSATGSGLFVDWPAENIPSDIKRHQLPDYLLFDDVARNTWLGIRMAVKLMSRPGHRKMGMHHLAKYAKNMFGHQLHRRHVYNLMVCGTEATFVRLDRAGLLYSPVVDLCKDAETFIRAFASLMMLDRADEGFDTLFTIKKNADNLVVYYLDLPSDAIPSQSDSDNDIPPTRKFQVRKTIRHNADIVGSATTVLLLREVLEPTKRNIQPLPARGKGKRKRVEAAPVEEERIGDTDYIMKILWRDPKEFKEADLYEETNGMYGIAQHTWARDASRRCTCAEPMEECATCVVEIGHIPGLEVCNVLTDLIFLEEDFDSEEDGREGPELGPGRYRPAKRRRPHLIYSYILMSSIGVRLRDAQTPHQYMNAVLDAVLGYWRIFNLGYIHRDISEGNVLMLKPEQGFTRREWLEPVTELSDIEDEDIRESERKLREVVAKLDRDPTGMLLDFNLCTQHSGKSPVETKTEIEFHGYRKGISDMYNMGRHKRQRPNTTKSYAFRDTSEPPSECEDEAPVMEYRTGTRPFMSAAVLGSTSGKPYRHSYLDDLESFFWMIYLSAVSHIDKGKRPNKYQINESTIFAMPDLKKLAKFKAQAVDRHDRIFRRLDRYDNSWARSYPFKKVLSVLEDFFRDVWNQEDPGMTPVEAFTKFTDVLLVAASHEN